MKKTMLLLLTLMLCGRAMTLAFLPQAGGTNPGDPPLAWLMPLMGDAIVGVTGLWIAFLIIKKTGLWVWSTILVWNAVAIWDALSAFIIHLTNPWPEFFMIEIFGSSMFFAAAFMHLVNIVLLSQQELKSHFLGGR